MSADLVARLRALDSCAVSDALDGHGHEGTLLGLLPLWPARRVVAGRVRTLRVGPKEPGSGPAPHLGTALIEQLEPGEVILVDAGGRTDVSSWGGILTAAALEAGCAGVVIDGACRDIHESEAFGLPVFGRTVVPRSARGRIVQLGMDETVTLCERQVASGDLVVADACGAVVVPAQVAESVVELAERIAAREADMLRAVRSGRSVVEVMHDSKFPEPRQEPT